jgi:ubiquinone/menaquinone biosynthesis C-methylase UbiE
VECLELKLNLAETLLVNNSVRSAVQRWFEAPLLRRLAGPLDGARVLEIGCGNGNGLRILLEQFGAGHVCGIDLDPRQLRRARRHLRAYPAGCATLLAAHAACLPFPDATFDAVFDFGVLHHVPAWQAAVAEIRRVLKPGAAFFFEEVTRAALDRWLYRAFLTHPRTNRFSEAEFLAEVAAQGIAPGADLHRILAGDIFIGAGHT